MAEKPQVTSTKRRKAELISELEWARGELSRNFEKAKHELNPVTHIRNSIVHKKTAWFAGAAVAGLILSWLPGRKKKKADKTTLPGKADWVKESERTGFLLALISMLFKVFKPAIASLVARKISSFPGWKNLGWRNLHR